MIKIVPGFIKGSLMASVLLFSFSEAEAIDPVHLILKATANETKLGFTEGQEVTFTLTLNPLFAQTGNSGFNGSGAWWGAAELEAPLFSYIGITGLTGAFSPDPGAEPVTTFSLNTSGGITAQFNYANLGYQADGQDVWGISTSFFIPDDIFNIPTVYIDPTTYFSNYLGTYLVEHTNGLALQTRISEVEIDWIEFSAVEFSVVPEPSSLGLLFAGAAGALWMARRRRIGFKEQSAE